MAIESLTLKMVGLFGILAECLIFVFLPLKIQKFGETLFSYGEVFAAGVFLGGGLFHMIPEAHEGLSGGHESHDSHFHLAFFYALLCFVVLLYIDKAFIPTLVLWDLKRKRKRKRKGESMEKEIEKEKGFSNEDDLALIGKETSKELDFENKDIESDKGSTNEAEDNRGKAGHHHIMVPHGTRDEKETQGKVISIVLVLALTIHSLLAGMSLGVAKKTGALAIMIALLSHKAFEAFALGVALVKGFGNQLKYLIFCALIFVFSTPLGIVIGLLLHGINQEAKSIVMALAGGSFLWCALAEINGAFTHKSPNKKVFFFALGVALMVVVTL
ncbi:zinc transporter zip1 [Anaeramoeba flamelloides]|uniref:Zinc transporter zip1 n=1 Tax=Anaeramoeba flamelloides TaxID=1746091 RepID=A0ABQ8X723_9EUKA|nr:zinc transporter zip1 [Anaeramoeba flamelloides]